MCSSTKIAVIGGGSWATALVKMLCNNAQTVNWWMRNEGAVGHLIKYQHNPNYLQSVEFNREKINVSSDLEEIIKQSEILVVAVPSAFVYETFSDLDESLFKNKIVFCSIKGIIPQEHRIPNRFFEKNFNIPKENLGIISGPCHAEEVAMERLSYLTVASSCEKNATLVSELLTCRYIKTTVSDDSVGTEISAILKNVYALAAGICAGLGYGDNFQSVLIANASQEMERFIDVVHPIHRDVKSSAYLGDLLVTAYSRFSRNRTFGFMIGKGYSVKTAQLEMDMVAEGYYAVKSIMHMNKKFEVDLPITEAVYNILYERISPVIEMRILADKLS